MAAIDILKTDAPVMQYYTHMNKAYLFLEQNGLCYRGQDFDTITIVATAYGEDEDGNLNYNDALSSWNETYQQYQIVVRQEPEGFDPYNIWVQLSNHWYEIQLHFNFQYNTGEDGSNKYESKTSSFAFDNRLTTLTNQQTSRFFTGQLKDDLQREKEINVWFGVTPSEYIVWDLLANNLGTAIRQVTNVVDNEPQILAMEESYLGMIRYILNQKELTEVFLNNFGDVAPDPTDPKAIFTFLVYLNGFGYRITFNGDFQFIIDNATEGEQGVG